jgi:hypothetical protein
MLKENLSAEFNNPNPIKDRRYSNTASVVYNENTQTFDVAEYSALGGLGGCQYSFDLSEFISFAHFKSLTQFHIQGIGTIWDNAFFPEKEKQ